MESCYSGNLIIESKMFDYLSPIICIILGLYAITKVKTLAQWSVYFFLFLIPLMLLLFLFLEIIICRFYDFFTGAFGLTYLLVLVCITLAMIIKTTDPSKILPTENVVIDGNNILGKADWDFTKLVNFYQTMVQSGLTPKLIFDNTIYRNLIEDGLIIKGQTIEDSLTNLFNCSKSAITVSQKGEKADPLIIQYAIKYQCAVISRDQFNKEEDSDFSSHAARLKKAGMIFGVKMISNALVVDGQPKRNKLLFWVWVSMLIILIFLILFTPSP